ncbi:MAG: 4-alpha-glucanotransferase, partial [Muribaculaceae bacterium]|nr:4-alpha-glucanotransferase [Muribaculaceae bacterium]
MKLSFHIDYRTNWGESVFIVGDPMALGAGDMSSAVKMTLTGTENWCVEVEVPDTVREFEYRYFVRHDNGGTKDEWGRPHRFVRGRSAKNFNINDRWQDQPWDKPYYSSAFTDCICHRSNRQKALAPKNGFVNIRITAPMVKTNQTLAICGASESLGGWNPAKAVRLSDANFPEWEVNVDAKDLKSETEYKFLIIDSESGELVAWEGGGNRRIGVTPEKDVIYTISGMRFINPLTPWKGAGTAIPVFSVRSDEDFGVGDFMDLKKMIDWLAETGQTILQILPINDTTMTHTWTDSYPYNANSCFALHPMFMRLSELGTLADPARQAYFDNLGRELNDLKEIDYERVNQGKIEFFREIFAQEGAKVIASDEYKEFVEANRHWLMPYAAFCVLRDRFGTPDFSFWGEYASFSDELLDRFVKDNAAEIDYVCYLQYNLDKQLRHVRDYAHSKGVAIKGDIPIGISRT